jgi:hypothetical protein
MIRATGTISKSFIKYLRNVPGKHEIKDPANSHIGHCAHTVGSTYVKVQNSHTGHCAHTAGSTYVKVQNSHTGHCAHTAGSTYVKVQNSHTGHCAHTAGSTYVKVQNSHTGHCAHTAGSTERLSWEITWHVLYTVTTEQLQYCIS